MKRVLALALTLLLAVGMLVGCASEGGDANHVHTFDYSKWSYDANGHWFNATCDCEVGRRYARSLFALKQRR